MTRFVWVAPAGTEPGIASDTTGKALEDLADLLRAGRRQAPGALVAALSEFSSRGSRLPRIESRPLRSQLGRYYFFVDADGKLIKRAAVVADAIAALRGKAESVRILGSYPLV